MLQQTIVITNRDGLDAKFAAMLVQVACRYRSQILIEQGSKIINAKSMMGVLSLGVGARDQVTLMTNGADEKEAMQAVSALLTSGFKS
ncbi:MAG: HPr family phosphocarrier protein [Candidatus Spyradocola sp.]|jgi:phosphocarrier protein HPr